MTTTEHEFIDAIRHAVEWGGKRLRPILAMLAYEQSTGEKCPESFIDACIWLEFIHCYTLVHDDLPCMDNDELRRGKPTVWKKYGETMAVLVGDALQTMAFEELAKLRNIDVITKFAESLGHKWVVLGQIKDTLELQSDYTVEDIMRVHDAKTGGFIATCLVIGALVGGATQEKIDQFERFGILLGRAFQVRDDILDVEWDITKLWKSIGKDIDQNKWLIKHFGLDQTRKILEELSSELDDCLKNWNNEKLSQVKEYVINREY
jgi:geranylgeranyl pyrophosphate synthase